MLYAVLFKSNINGNPNFFGIKMFKFWYDQSDQLEKINHFSEFDRFDRSRGPDRKHLKPSSFHLQSGDRIFTTRFYFSVLQPSSWRPHNIHEITLNSSKSFPICNDYLKVRPEAKDLYFEIVQKVFCNGTRFLLERNWHWISKLLSSKERKRKTIVEEERKVEKLWGVPRDSCTIVSLHFQSLVIYSFFFHLFFLHSSNVLKNVAFGEQNRAGSRKKL